MNEESGMKIQATRDKRDKQQGPVVQHRELHNGKESEKRMYRYAYN